MMLAEPNCSILIPSCDKYSDLWIPFFTMFWRNWPDCPFPVYLGSNEEVFEHPKVENILVGPDKDWTSGVRKMVESLDTEYILIMLEDFFIRKPVDSNRILFLLDTLKGLDGHMLRLGSPQRRPFLHMKESSDLIKLMVRTPYRVNLHPTIWKINALLAIMSDGESAAEFEVKASERSNKCANAYLCLRNERPLEWREHVVEKGKWFLTEARRFEKAGIGCDFSRRPVMTRTEQILWTIQKRHGWLEKKLVPWTLRKRIGRIIRGAKREQKTSM